MDYKPGMTVSVKKPDGRVDTWRPYESSPGPFVFSFETVVGPPSVAEPEGRRSRKVSIELDEEHAALGWEVVSTAPSKPAPSKPSSPAPKAEAKPASKAKASKVPASGR